MQAEAESDLDKAGPPPAALDLGYLALFAGMQCNARVLQALHRAGHAGLRESHGYLIQHLLAGPRTASDLARRMGVSQQAGAKAVAELSALGYLEDAAAADGRSRRVRLSRRGRRMIQSTRRLRADLLEQALAGLPVREVEAARRVLAHCLERLGGMPAVRGRRIVQPR